jgi:fructose-1,6-bisphosphatase|tara:strand:+ start:1372 stop:1575 length:204 start_codon:yes stop_codon:yes gene_type:complete
MAYYDNKNSERREQLEKEKQEGITILAIINSAIAMEQHGLNINNVKRNVEELLQYRDELLYGKEGEE